MELSHFQYVFWTDMSLDQLQELLTDTEPSAGDLNRAMRQAICDKRVDMVEVLLQHGADSNYLWPIIETTPLMCVVQYCQESSVFDAMLSVLRRHGVDLNKVSRYGNTALSLAFDLEAFPSAIKLVRQGADVNNLYRSKRASVYNSFQRFRHSSDPHYDYTVWLELRYNLRGLNRMLVHYGLDVAKFCSLNTTGGCRDAQELLTWMAEAKRLVQQYGPAKPPVTPNSPATLMSLCRDRLLEPDCNRELLSRMLPERLRQFLSVLDVADHKVS